MLPLIVEPICIDKIKCKQQMFLRFIGLNMIKSGIVPQQIMLSRVLVTTEGGMIKGLIGGLERRVPNQRQHLRLCTSNIFT